MHDVPTALAVPPTATSEWSAGQGARPFSLAMVGGLLAFHALLGVAGALSPIVPTLHAGAVALTVLALAFTSHRPDRIAAATAYGALGDIYWRMTSSRAPWELSKYLLIVGSVALLVRFARTWKRPAQPVAYLLCLVPGVVMTILSEGVLGSRELLVDSALGAFALGIAVLAARTLVLTDDEAWNLSWVMAGVLMMPLAITSYHTLKNNGLTFTSESNFDVTGGYGPNQVSSALGLLILLCVLLGFQRRGPRFLLLLVPLAGWALWATLLTFSRGGLYSVVIAGCAMVLVGLASRGARARSLTILVVGVIGLAITFSSVNDFTGNWLDTRYSDAESTQSTAGRSSLIDQDVRVFEQHPLFGVGVGQSLEHHQLEAHLQPATHTEQSRLVAEHGLLGLGALVLLGAMVVSGYRHSLGYWNRLLVVGAAAWSLTTMLHAATRLAAVSLVFALSQIRVEEPSRRPMQAVRRYRGPRGRDAGTSSS
jgi:O-antigen ligase